MATNHTSKKYTYLKIFIIVIVALCIFAYAMPQICLRISWAMLSSYEKVDFLNSVVNREQSKDAPAEEDTASTDKTEIKQDSVFVTNGKVSRDDFDLNYSAETWYKEFMANKVAFDRKYDHQQIDIVGTITAITNDNCATIRMKTGISYFDTIVFVNCLYGVDKWSDEVTNVAVGDQVHIRGYYSGAISSDLEMDITKCHIIKD